MENTLEPIAAPRIEINDAGRTMEEIRRWSDSLTTRVNDLQKRKHVSEEEWQRFEEEFPKLDAAVRNLDTIVKANASRFSAPTTGRIELDPSRFRLRCEGKHGADLPKMSREYYNIMALGTDELLGMSSMASRIAGGTAALSSADPNTAYTAAKIERLKERNDRICFKDAVLAASRRSWKDLPRNERIKTLPEWREYETLWNEVNARALNEGTGSAGGYLVPVILSSRVGDLVEAQLRVAALFPRITMTSKTFEWPFRKSRSTAYHVSEATSDDPAADNMTASQQSFGKPIWSAQRLADLIFVSDDVDEDSIESAVDLAMQDSIEVLAHGVEDGIINGEYLAATMDGATFNPASGTKRWCNGLRFHALLTASYPAQADAAGALTHAHGLDALELMGPYGMAAAVADVVWITGYRGYRNMFLTNSGDSRYFETLATAGPQAGLLTGTVGFWLGHPVVLSEKVPLTNASGVIDATPANNIKGTVLGVNRRRYAVGDRKAASVEESMHVAFRKFQTAVRSSLRLDFEGMDTGGDTPRVLDTGKTPVSIIYNIT